MTIDLRNPIPQSFEDWFQALSPNNQSQEEKETFLRGARELYKNPMLRKILGVMEAQCLDSIRLCPLEDIEVAEQHRKLLSAVGYLRSNLESFSQELDLLEKPTS